MESRGFTAEDPAEDEKKEDEANPSLDAAAQEIEEYLENGSPELRELWENYKTALASTEA